MFGPTRLRRVCPGPTRLGSGPAWFHAGPLGSARFRTRARLARSGPCADPGCPAASGTHSWLGRPAPFSASWACLGPRELDPSVSVREASPRPCLQALNPARGRALQVLTAELSLTDPQTPRSGALLVPLRALWGAWTPLKFLVCESGRVRPLGRQLGS